MKPEVTSIRQNNHTLTVTVAYTYAEDLPGFIRDLEQWIEDRGDSLDAYRERVRIRTLKVLEEVSR